MEFMVDKSEQLTKMTGHPKHHVFRRYRLLYLWYLFRKELPGFRQERSRAFVFFHKWYDSGPQPEAMGDDCLYEWGMWGFFPWRTGTRFVLHGQL